MISHCECGWRVMHQHAMTIACPQCAKEIVCDGEERPISKSALPDQWPTWTILVKCCRDKEDVGIGDTVKRMAATIGGERFKRWAQQCGIPCGCTERQEKWNKLYPY